MLNSVSFSPFEDPFSLMDALRWFHLRRLRLVVTYNGMYYSGFGPDLIERVFEYLPGLEEIILDHGPGMVMASLPGTMVRHPI